MAAKIDPAWWRTQAVNGERLTDVLARRDIAAVFRFLRSRGFSQTAISAHAGITENRVRTILNGTSQVTGYEVLERIAAGLEIPRELMGLGLATEAVNADAVKRADDPGAARPHGTTERVPPPDTAISATQWPSSSTAARRIAILQSSLGIPAADAARIEAAAGDVIEVGLDLDLEVDADGRARLAYRHELLVLSGPPVTRLAREVWFKHADRDIRIEPFIADRARIMIQRIHDTPTLAKFACQISPSLAPGDRASFAYTVEGGLFLTEHYWRQSMPRYVHRYVLRLRHRDAGELRSCVAIEERPDGSENTAGEQLVWGTDGADIVVTLARDHLRPNQAVTLRWDFDGETARRGGSPTP